MFVMTKLIFYPLNNADCCLVKLNGGKTILYDYANTGSEEACDLPEWLKADLDGKEEIDVVAFSHSDQDHVKGAKDFFYMEWATKYQSDDRIKIKELWVPADMITERHPYEDESARVLREEARYRLKQGTGVKVFSRPGRLEDWLKANGLTVESRASCIVNAGNIINTFNLASDGIEIFAHAPFSMMDGEEVIDKNTNSLVHHLRIEEGLTTFDVLMCADAVQSTLDGIVTQTKKYRNEDRLAWDIMKVAHHCSSKSLNDTEKGQDETEPSENIKWLLEQAKDKAVQVMTCKRIPDEDTDQPPHKQAHKTYVNTSTQVGGEILVTMDKHLKRTVIELDECGYVIKRNELGAAAILTSTAAPKVG
ncbi:hypothetical protein Rhal01_00248 [Rubritalea halochordaticola]|uniref:MBL fold metallo-hydrolase n=2 Tax=Rubritalea halochordaticola TaxID=714537 RepID=A0ABP9V0G9_9BACT